MLITKGELMSAKESLRLASLGYELMDRKNIILMQELSQMMSDAKLLRESVDEAYTKAYHALQRANISLGVIQRIADITPIEAGVKIVMRSVMGIEIPVVSLEAQEITLPYSLSISNSRLDEVYLEMRQVKILTIQLAQIDIGMFRLAQAIQKSRKRANALDGVVIPDLKVKIKHITEALEEKDREEFTRMKLVKRK